MKTRFVSLLAALGLGVALLLGGCVYEVPLAEEANVPVDPALLGTWTLVQPDDPANSITAVVSQLSATEYVVATTGYAEKTQCYRAWPVEFDGVRYLQLQGLNDGTFKKNEKVYLLGKLDRNGDHLNLSLLMLKGEFANSDALQQALRENISKPDTFRELYTGARLKR
ncbi:hypothetical protein H5P28_17735 [Ruficoccus amylovorans]|uniref:Uncharacterized protein n=1 Tax=Ruficoccus amylovorans TaxID=1804625 RepID=A0A842HHW1_9BACT|nr:hypothetical protein [Ruficoccus amylovorans]MBC2596113.1 hypothetical protein [Ruficoccus amylovorans]